MQYRVRRVLILAWFLYEVKGNFFKKTENDRSYP